MSERVEGINVNDITVEIYKDDIDLHIAEWMKERNITDMCKVSQNRWYNCCKYVYEHVFKNNKYYLKDITNAYGRYDIQKVSDVLDIYIDLCNDYEKVINITGFTFFTGIHRDTINDWSHGCQGHQFASKSSDIFKKLDQLREESLVALQTSGKNNPMCYMPSLNKYCGFNMPGVRQQESAHTISIEQIQQKYRQLPAPGSADDADLPDVDLS